MAGNLLHSTTRRVTSILRVLFALTARPVIGGQAVIEGVMMRSPKSLAIAVRRPDGGIVLREEAWLSFGARLPLLRWPLLRGATMLVESLYNGIVALNFSASIAYPEDEGAKQEAAQAEQGKGHGALWLTLAISLAFAFALFKGVPHLSAWGLGRALGGEGASALPMTSPLFHLVDGGIKLALFVGYILFISRMHEVKRLFMYHGAEHKSVHVWEAAEPLDVEHARGKSTAHPRCGTSLILLVIATSIVVFAGVLPFVPMLFANDFAQAVFLLVVKIPLLLPIAGIAYEGQRFAARNPGNLLIRALIAPGMLLQRLTTREPGDAELEVALAALQKTVWRERQGELVALPARQASVEVYESFDAVAKSVA
ncbi:MAG: hypothetical protein A2138_13990 [Deltaproteobacteria bacterium RBG_16_71_12]|nr:MAG: hypothetical protein A2138_13990 [Deltaproteobacteria bacterium RBG_16_71_12]